VSGLDCALLAFLCGTVSSHLRHVSLTVPPCAIFRSLEKEAHDRVVTNFSAAQLVLITAVTSAAKGPVVAFVFSGGAMDVSPLLSNPKIGAVIVCGQPSINVVAVGDVVFGTTLDGRRVAPAG
jgi:hypothetical protein